MHTSRYTTDGGILVLHRPVITISKPSITAEPSFSSPTIWQGQAELVLLSENEDGASRTRYMCILLEDDARNPRGARFVISRIDSNKTFLHFDCPLKLIKRAADKDEDEADGQQQQQRSYYVHVARLADAGQEFIIEKIPTPQDLRIPRPQNRKQYSDRLIVTADMLIWALSTLMKYYCKYIISLAIVTDRYMVMMLPVLYWFPALEIPDRPSPTIPPCALPIDGAPPWVARAIAPSSHARKCSAATKDETIHDEM
ncbi:hypothetical protein MFIFM68171_02897 [Madurella fahalii]|uniref:Uncharacterized protein n=1 Tax=Madurella fahalii TaxID=1157608 RepID=A0ABQ0G4L7_9PEZI